MFRLGGRTRARKVTVRRATSSYTHRVARLNGYIQHGCMVGNNLAHRMTNQLEKDVREIARNLYNMQIAFIFKVPEEMQQTPVDFFGHTTEGLAIFIECKQVRRTSLPIGKDPGIAPHQWVALRQANACGVLTYVIWRNEDFTALIPFRVCEEFFNTRRSIPWADGAAAYVVPNLQLALVKELTYSDAT